MCHLRCTRYLIRSFKNTVSLNPQHNLVRRWDNSNFHFTNKENEAERGKIFFLWSQGVKWSSNPNLSGSIARVQWHPGLLPRAHVAEAHGAVQRGVYMATPLILSWGGGHVVIHTLVDNARSCQMASITSMQWLFYFTQSFNIHHKHTCQTWCTMTRGCCIYTCLSFLPPTRAMQPSILDRDRHISSTHPSGSESARESWHGWKSQNTARVPPEYSPMKTKREELRGTGYVNTPSRDLRGCWLRRAPQETRSNRQI